MDAIQIFTTICAIAGIAGGASGWFAKSRGDTIITLQGKEIEYWKDRATALEKDLTAATSQRDSLKGENERLWARAQGSAQLTKLAKEIKSLVSYIKSNGIKK